MLLSYKFAAALGKMFNGIPPRLSSPVFNAIFVYLTILLWASNEMRCMSRFWKLKSVPASGGTTGLLAAHTFAFFWPMGCNMTPVKKRSSTYYHWQHHMESKKWTSKYFPGGASGRIHLRRQAIDVKHAGSIPGLGRSPGGGNGHPLQDSCLENPMDRGAWGG